MPHGDLISVVADDVDGRACLAGVEHPGSVSGLALHPQAGAGGPEGGEEVGPLPAVEERLRLLGVDVGFLDGVAGERHVVDPLAEVDDKLLVVGLEGEAWGKHGGSMLLSMSSERRPQESERTSLLYM